jgi:hypothetical protein
MANTLHPIRVQQFAWHGRARQGMAGRGAARQGNAMQGKHTALYGAPQFAEI